MNPLRRFPVRAAGALVLLLAAPLRAALDPTAWEFRQSFELGAAGPVRVSLPAGIRERARADAADLRLVGPDGAEVAFALLQPEDAPSRPPFSVPLKPRLAGTTTVIEFTLPQTTEVEMLTLDTPAAQFLKAVTIEAALGDGAWRVLSRDLVFFRLGGGVANLAAELDGSAVSRFRLTIDDSREAPVPFTRAFVHARPLAGWTPDTVEAPVRGVESAAGTTRLVVDLGVRHRKVVGVAIDAREPVFLREVRAVAPQFADNQIVEQTLAVGVVRRVALPGGRSFSATVFPANFTAPAASLELLVVDGDNPPLTVERVSVRVAPETVAFAAARAGRYTFLAGRTDAARPDYDVAAFRRDWLHLVPTPVVPGEVEPNPGYRAPALTAEIPELAGAFDAKGWKHERPVAIAESGAQALELDLAVLAQARRDLGDLRLVRDGRQVPYIVQHTNRLRVLGLELAAAPDPKRKNVGRWKITLPVAGAPLTSLTFEVAEPLFERRAEVSELRRDERGQTYAVPLGSAIWTRRRAEDPARFHVPLAASPATTELILELDHGDNAPFAPTKAEAAYPLRRLRFRAPAGAATVLHFGNPAVGAPRYDLQLAAPRLLAAPENRAVLAPLVENSGRGGSRFSLGGGVASLVLWVALGLVVVVLLVFVAKLLPKPPEKK